MPMLHFTANFLSLFIYLFMFLFYFIIGIGIKSYSKYILNVTEDFK